MESSSVELGTTKIKLAKALEKGMELEVLREKMEVIKVTVPPPHDLTTHRAHQHTIQIIYEYTYYKH